MQARLLHDTEETLYVAGERVPPGVYKQIGGTRRIFLEREDTLPASLDGQVACYVRMSPLTDLLTEAVVFVTDRPQ